MRTLLRFLGLVILLNVIRYFIGGPIEFPLVLNRMMGVNVKVA